MKRSILIIAFGVVSIALLLTINEKWIKETSAPKTATKQQETAGRAKLANGKAKEEDGVQANTKPPAFDLSKKAHWYDPETTMFHEGDILLSELLDPFHPTPEEFQFIAQYENELNKLEESLSEDEYYSVEGRLRLRDKVSKLNEQLWDQLGEERGRFYAEIRNPGTRYWHTWKILTVNGIAEERVAEFRELADEFTRQMHGYTLYRGERQVPHYWPEGWKIPDNRNQIAKTFRDRIEKEFGRQVLDDILSQTGFSVFMELLEYGVDPMRAINLRTDPKQRERLETLYGVKFASQEEMDEDLAENERLKKREMEFREKWAEYQAQQQSEAESASGDSL